MERAVPAVNAAKTRTRSSFGSAAIGARELRSALSNAAFLESSASSPSMAARLADAEELTRENWRQDLQENINRYLRARID
jgi:hypothetical protein